MVRVLLLAATLVACGQDDSTSQECDADCRVRTAWTLGPFRFGGVGSHGRKSTDPTERMLVARTVMENGHVEGGEVCDFVENPLTRDYCIRLSHRPHLFEAPPPKAGRLKRAAGGPINSELLPARPVLTPAADVPAADLTGCGEGEGEAACADRLAMYAARRGHVRSIAGLCNAVSAPRLRSECRFSAAEAAVGSGARVVGQAVPLCMAAGSTAHCLAHGDAALREGPAADAQAAAGRTSSRVQMPREALRPMIRPWRHRQADRVYSEATASAYAKAGTLDGRPFDALPGEQRRRYGPPAWELVKRGSLKDGWTSKQRCVSSGRRRRRGAEGEG